jgi:hypothetical protein
MNNDPGPRGIGAFLPPILLSRLGGRLDEGARLRSLWQRLVPAPLSQHTHPQHYESGCLLVSADSGAWATRLRYQQGDVIRRLAGDALLAGLNALRIRVAPIAAAPETPAPRPGRRRAHALSDEAAVLLQGVAHEVKDPELRAALLRLAQRHAGALRRR